jgi:hypothetical protein
LTKLGGLQINRKQLSMMNPLRLIKSRMLQSNTGINNNTQPGVCGDNTVNTGE